MPLCHFVFGLGAKPGGRKVTEPPARHANVTTGLAVSFSVVYLPTAYTTETKHCAFHEEISQENPKISAKVRLVLLRKTSVS